MHGFGQVRQNRFFGSNDIGLSGHSDLDRQFSGFGAEKILVGFNANQEKALSVIIGDGTPSKKKP
ncbi:MAG: hypothetical protein AAF353_21565 [Pseudomonadota bacterium]